MLKDYYSIYVVISLFFTFITLIIGFIIFSLIHQFLKIYPNKKNEILIRLILLLNVFILIIGLLVCILVIALEFISPPFDIIHLHIMLFLTLSIFLLSLILLSLSLRRSPFIKEKETETTYGIPPKYVRRTKKQRVDLKNIKNYLDSYEELIKDSPNGINSIIKEEVAENIKKISGYYSKLNDDYKIKFKKIAKFLENQE